MEHPIKNDQPIRRDGEVVGAGLDISAEESEKHPLPSRHLPGLAGENDFLGEDVEGSFDIEFSSALLGGESKNTRRVRFDHVAVRGVDFPYVPLVVPDLNFPNLG